MATEDQMWRIYWRARDILDEKDPDMHWPAGGMAWRGTIDRAWFQACDEYGFLDKWVRDSVRFDEYRAVAISRGDDVPANNLGDLARAWFGIEPDDSDLAIVAKVALDVGLTLTGAGAAAKVVKGAASLAKLRKLRQAAREARKMKQAERQAAEAAKKSDKLIEKAKKELDIPKETPPPKTTPPPSGGSGAGKTAAGAAAGGAAAKVTHGGGAGSRRTRRKDNDGKSAGGAAAGGAAGGAAAGAAGAVADVVGGAVDAAKLGTILYGMYQIMQHWDAIAAQLEEFLRLMSSIGPALEDFNELVLDPYLDAVVGAKMDAELAAAGKMVDSPLGVVGANLNPEQCEKIAIACGLPIVGPINAAKLRILAMRQYQDQRDRGFNTLLDQLVWAAGLNMGSVMPGQLGQMLPDAPRVPDWFIR